MTGEAWRGALLLDPGWALYVGPAGDTKPHRHHAVQLAVALEAPVEVELQGAAATLQQGLLIGADVEHRVDGGGKPLAR